MPKFDYRGRDARGSAVRGQLEAQTLDAVVVQLASDGVTPIDISPASAPAKAARPMPDLFAPRAPGRTELALFCRQLYTLVKAGVPIIRGLSRLAESTREPLASNILEIIDDLEAGRDLGGALRRHPRTFSPLFVAMVRVGEVSGRLEEALLRLHDYLDREIRTSNAIKTALRYPAMVMIALVIALFVIMTLVIPRFASFYSANHLELPLATRVIMGVSQFCADYWYAIVLGAAAAVTAVVRYVRTESGRLWWDRTKLGIPRIGSIVRRATLARFARAFAMGMHAGVPILQALSVTARALDNEHVASKVEGMREGIEHGESLTRVSARSQVFTALVLQMLDIGEETGRLPEMLDDVAEFYEREVDYDIKRLSALIEPLLTAAMAVLVLILALGVFLPMWDLAKMAQG